LVTQGYPTANCSDELEIRVGYDTYLNPDGETLHGLIRFNLAGISTEATVHTATLWLFLSGSYDVPGYSMPVTPHRISSPWAVDTVTWDSRPSYAEAYTSTWVLHGAWGWYPFDVTSLVQRCVMGTYPDYGLLLRGPAGYNGWRAFAASETTYPPHLIVSYEQSPDLILTLVPDTQTVSAGQTTSSSSILYLTATDGFSESTTLDIAGLPPGATYAWSADSVTPTASTLLTITTAPTTPRGAYTLTITGTSASLVRTTPATLHVLQPDFEISLRPSLRSVWSGEDAYYTAHLTATDGFTASVALDIGGLPANTTYEWEANPVTPTTSTQLTITTALDTPGGLYTLTVTGTAGSLVHTSQAVLYVSEPDFELSLVPSWRSIQSGESAQYTAYLTATEDLTTAVTLNVGGLPANATHAWSINPVTPTGSALLTITTAPDTPGGLYTLTVTGTSGSLVHTAQAALYVSEADFELTLEPSLRSVTVGESAHYTAHLVALGGFTGSVMLDADGVPSNTSSEWSSNPVEPTASTVLTIVTTQDTPTGTYALTVTGTSGDTVHNAYASLTVKPASFITETVYLPLVLRDYSIAGDVTHHPWRAIVGPPRMAPDVTQDTPVSRIALVIGIADYEHMEPASGTRAGAVGNDLWLTIYDAIKAESTFATRGGFDDASGGTIILFLDAQATKAAIHAAIVNLIDRLEDESTVIVIFFSGHGMYAPDDDGDENDPYDELIVPYEIEWDSVEERWRYEMAISDDELDDWLSLLESQHIAIIVDSCFSGGLIETSSGGETRGLAWRPASQSQVTATQWQDGLSEDIQGPGRVVLTASTEDQASWEFGELQDGVFTYYLLEAFRTPSADTNSNGWISAEEAHTYLSPLVDAYVWPKVGEHQNPQMSDGVSGELDLVQLSSPVTICPAW
jgi:hypothetical protein